MRKLGYSIGIFLGIGLTIVSKVSGLDVDFVGQLSGWTTETNIQDEWQNQSGVRYLPQLTLTQMVTDEMFLDANTAFNGFVTYASDTDETDSHLKLYRLALRLATNQTETRIGLQKINFGPAQLLRPLRWFDQLDQRDPLRMTDGVYAALFRYTALNNSNVWLWGLYGNDDVKGFESLPSTDDKVEFGGRAQYPVWNGELAATVHSRTVDGEEIEGDDFPETRIALDGRWEKGVGMWFESVLQYQDSEKILYEWVTMATLGVDYTFGIGNGLYAVLEHMATGASESPLGWDENAHITACMLSYPIGLFDSLSSISFYNWESEEFSQHLSWQRAYDNLVIDASLFRHPDQDDAESRTRQQAGFGGQLMLIYYH